MMTKLYIGLMSGTSADGIDAALVDCSNEKPTLIANHYTPHPLPLREKIIALCEPGENEIERLGELDILLGESFAHAVCELLKKKSLDPSAIQAIGSHGQTIRHAPRRFTLQIADPNTIAVKTKITTIADFRRKDMAHGGEGAPLLPAFHQHLFASNQSNRAIVNIGGIANVTLLAPQKKVIGYDIGPGNVLLDGWIQTHLNERFDKNGEWATQGQVDPDLLEHMLSDPYFTQPSPKSTGREYFNLSWIKHYLKQFNKQIKPIDVQATLVELTARSILMDIRKHFLACEILICGGGTHNVLLMDKISALAHPQFSVCSTQKYGIDPDWIEAMAFAWFAKQTLERKTSNVPSVTGAKHAAILGGIYYCERV
ncbi:MAG: anhydro-N-acetylmuramic acid kinase [Gammaproteobacteria bacterium RIFCSPHIGHO2_12_FULL_38_14]|nr:MAG: anhydro-N-acetylmuramic acid kinase [Gammaproteobacteria bacterium RIFCSPHIGHO2_12_FULL_38_14]